MKKILPLFIFSLFIVKFSVAQNKPKPFDIDADDKLSDKAKKNIVDSINVHRNMVWMDPAKIFFGAISFGYDRFSEDGSKALRIPFAYSFTKNFIETGLEYRFFFLQAEPKNYAFEFKEEWWGVRSFFMGPAAYVVAGAADLNATIALSGGGQVQLANRWNTSISAFGGPGVSFEDATAAKKPYAFFNFGLSIVGGYRF